MAPTADSLPAAFAANGAGLRVCILRARWNDAIISKLVDGCQAKLLAAGVKEADIVEETVPGSFELPFAAKSCVPSLLCVVRERDKLLLEAAAAAACQPGAMDGLPSRAPARPVD